MIPITRFSLAGFDAPSAKAAMRARLLSDGGPTSTRLPGRRVVSQFALDRGYLVATDFDDPWEEWTFVSLLDERFRLLSCRRLGSWGTAFASKTFSLKAIEWVDACHFVAVPFDEADGRYQFAIRAWGIPFLWPRLEKQLLHIEASS
ncbi:hypothetical protein [Aquabacterium sp.]|uniref:hypothetical protein n=1 Tax=Aquabacterium sp. TaxID=1872578 RepID=UPI0035B19C51